MKKKIITMGALAAVSAPIALVVACGAGEIASRDLGKHVYMYESSLQDDSNNIKVRMDTLTRDQIRTVPANIPAHYGSKVAAGGYGELRHFYPIDNSTHMGIDVFAHEGTKVIAPSNGEVINAVWRHANTGSNFAHGSGGNLLLRVQVKDLDIEEQYKDLVYIKYYKWSKNAIDPRGFRDETYYAALPKISFLEDGHLTLPNGEKIGSSDTSYEQLSVVNKAEFDGYVSSYVPKTSKDPTKQEVIDASKYLYIAFMHMSKKSIALYGETKQFAAGSETWIVSKKVNVNATPVAVTKGQTIGFVGNMDENGGWATHTHVEIHIPSLLPHGFMSLKSVHRWFTEKRRPLFGTGTYAGKMDRYGNYNNFQTLKGIMNPNNIYKFYDSETTEVNINENNIS